MNRPRWLISALIINGLISLAALGWVSWIAADPQYWFSGAYAQKGPRGDTGPRGDVGPPGPPGPVGPDAEDAINSVSSDVDTVAARVEDVEAALADVQSTVDDAQQALEDLCGAISSAYISANSATEDLLFELDLAC